MSKPTMITAQCPYCQATIDVPYVDEVNIENEPTIKEKILSGAFFSYTCPTCGEHLPVVGPLLYHDPTIPTMLYLIPPGFDTSTEKLDEMLELIQNIEGDKTSLYQARLVNSVDKLLEKIYIQDAKLDDRIVELVKLAYLKQYGHELQQKGHIHACIFVPAHEERSARIVFIFGDDHDMASVDFSEDHYVFFATEYAKQLDNASTVNKFLTIDEKWAAKFLADNA